MYINKKFKISIVTNMGAHRGGKDRTLAPLW